MLEAVQLGRRVDRATFAAREPELREALLDAQLRLKEAGFSVVIVIAGAEGSGKGDTVNLLLDWLDSRGIETHALGEPSEEERERPEFYRFWRRLPPRGSIGIFFGSWYTRPITQHSLGQIGDAELEDALRRITEFEEMLAQEGVLLVKLWLHITKAQQAKRFKRLARDPETAWRVTKRDWLFHRTYNEFVLSATRALRRTSSGTAPWHLVEAFDERYRHLTVAERLLEAIERRLSEVGPAKPAPEALPASPPLNLLTSLDLSRSVPEPAYREELRERQRSLGRMVRGLGDAQRSVVMVFEGMDAAGKGGCIRRVTQALDARFYHVVQIAAPTDEERSRPYLWRFWRRLPRWGHVTIFDRSWYGRVLVERVEGLCAPDDWRRAYQEINAFEEQLLAGQAVLLKFWLSISPEEQLRRFEEREARPYKRYKITEEDWRNRGKWDAYVASACEMIEQTSTEIAPWTLVEAEDKYHARLKVLRTFERALGPALRQ
jgi:polyphosphate:AMP phosphotransferase